MSKVCASPLSKSSIRSYAMKIRRMLGYNNKDFIHAPKLFDALSVLFEEKGLKFDYRVLPDDDQIFVNREEAFTDMATGIVYIKESVMEQACRRAYRRGTYTLIHELGHYLLHYLQEDANLARVSDKTPVPIYCDPEWQANTFASEFLMPFEECVNLQPDEIRKRFHVSWRAAEVRYQKVQEEINK